MASIDFPKLRSLEGRWQQQDGQSVFVLRDRLGLASHMAVVPPAIAVLLGMLDGTRDLEGVRDAFEVETGVRIEVEQLANIIGQLDEALLLDSPRFAAAETAALEEYRQAPVRSMALAGQVYPGDAESCRLALESYAPPGGMPPEDEIGEVRCVICPHIDYQRGGPVYYETWIRAVRAAGDAEVVVLFGTDHIGGAGRLTLTRQSYETPFGVLPTATDVVEAVVEAIGEEAAHAEELHHRIEHSIELGAVWLAYALNGRPVPVVPILCGSFHELIEGWSADGSEDLAREQIDRIDRAIAALARAIGGRKALVVAAADFAHVGPDFGDPAPFEHSERSELERADAGLLERIVEVDPEGFLARVRSVSDRYRVCGVPPIYLALRLVRELDGGMPRSGSSEGSQTEDNSTQSRGEVIAYDHCPTPADNGSWVSVAGALIS